LFYLVKKFIPPIDYFFRTGKIQITYFIWKKDKTDFREKDEAYFTGNSVVLKYKTILQQTPEHLSDDTKCTR